MSSLGVFDRHDGQFHAVLPDLDLSALQKIFREGTLKTMLRREKITSERVELLRSWRHSGFNLDSSRRLEAGARKSLESLLEYIERPPVSLERLTHRDPGTVVHRGKFHPGMGKEHQLTSGVELIGKDRLDDPELCPRCGAKMVVLAAISSPEQDDVIERILRHRGEWDPPWLRQRPVRGPPKQLELFEDFEESQVPAWNPEKENQDAPGDGWLE